MPWETTDEMKERTKFGLEWERWNEAQGGTVDMAELCRKYGVSRSAGYYWVDRYKASGHDLRSLESRSRRPHKSPGAISAELRDRLTWENAGLALRPEAIAVALDEQSMAVVQEAVEDRGGEHVVIEDLAPLRDELIGREEEAAPFVASGDELEEETGGAFLCRCRRASHWRRCVANGARAVAADLPAAAAARRTRRGESTVARGSIAVSPYSEPAQRPGRSVSLI